MNRRNFFSMDIFSDEKERGILPPIQNNAENIRFASRTTAGLEPFVPSPNNPWNYSKAAHLLRRAMVGPTDAEIRQAVTDGLDSTLTRLFTTFTPSLDLIQGFAGTEPQVKSADPDQASQTYKDWLTALFSHRDLLQRWWLKTFATSPVSIQERMTLFWHNHFVSEMTVVNFAEFMYVQNALLRVNCLGNFKTFVRAITTDPAMLFYLNGRQNYKTTNIDNINENYGRELMELFTMGVNDWSGNANYTQDDVHQAGRSLSGYILSPSKNHVGDKNYQGITSQFDSTRWDSGSKTYLGQTGNWNTDDVIRIIFEQRADQTAKYICTKIYRALVYDIPDQTIVAALAETFKTNKWEIKPVLDQLLRSVHFFDSGNIGALDKSPTDFMLGLIRGLGMNLATIPDFVETSVRNELTGRLTSIGQLVFNPPNVKGWAGGRTWVSTSTAPVRQKFSLDVIDGNIKGTGTPKPILYQYDPVAFAKTFPSPNDATKLVSDMANYLLNVPPSAKELAALLNALLNGAQVYDWNINSAGASTQIKNFLKTAFQLAKFQLY